MANPLTNKEVERLLSFVGYGNPSAPIWFLGMEEGGGGEENLRKRLSFNRFEDLYEGHRKLGILKHHTGSRVIQRTWWGMCMIMLDLLDRGVEREEIRRYQAEELGRTESQTFLLEMMPLPKPNIGAWGYEDILPQFESREDYYQRILPKRIIYLRRLLKRYSPSIVIGYGKSFWSYYQNLFPGVRFSNKDVFEIGKGETLVLLAPHFTARSMNGQFGNLANLARPAFRVSQHKILT